MNIRYPIYEGVYRILTNDEPEPDANKNKKPAAATVNWLDIFDAFVGDDVAVMEKYQAMPVATAFRLLNKRIRDTQKQKK